MLSARMFDGLKKTIATVVFCGYAPKAPGTAGSAAAAVLYYYFCSSLQWYGWVALLLGVFVVAVWAADGVVPFWGKDPGRVVVDELIGQLVTLAFLPHGFWMALCGFFIFRAFDIIKPFPVRHAERLPGGWGIVMDDVLAGVYGNLLLWAGWAAGRYWQLF